MTRARAERREPSRLAQWQRLRLRRVLAALLVGCAVVVGLTALSAPPEPTTNVVVAARSLPAGHQLQPRDLRVEQWPDRLAKAGFGDPKALTGKRISGPVDRAEPLTRSRLLRADRLAPPQASDLVVGIPTDDAVLARLLQPGDQIDVLDAAGATVALRARVVAALPADPDAAGWRGGAPSVLVSVSRASAAAIARARTDGSPSGRSALTLALSTTR